MCAETNTQRIRVLPSSVAEKIAAGEVIERPASVVKELLENSLDAGATEIQVTLRDGGKGLIEVLDNGEGMSAADVELSVIRHATSKIRELGDLERLVTLGFRGEALPSVAAVSELRILSRAKGSSSANEFFASAGECAQAVTFGHFLGTQHGTRIQVQGLFSQVPARLKFLKSVGAEVSQVRDWMERLALSHSQVGFKLLSEDRVILNLRPQSEADRVRVVLGEGGDYPVVFEDRNNEFQGIRVRAYWLQGLSIPQTRRLAQMVNGRSVKDRMLQQAMLAPFKQALLPGQFPAAVIFVEVDPGEVDVNVHPAKAEVRFLDSRRVFSAVSGTLEGMIGRVGAPAFVAGERQAFGSTWKIADGGMTLQVFPAGQVEKVASEGTDILSSRAPFGFAPSWCTDPSESLSQPAMPEIPRESPERRFQSPDSSQYIGAIFNTYLMYDLGDELGMVDQHAAHERVRYETLKRRALAMGQTQKHQQALLVPEVVPFAADRRGDLESRLAWLESLGFEAELFGEDRLLIRAVPAEWGMDEIASRLKGLVERLLEAETRDAGLGFDEALFEKLASEACKSSVRAGDRLVREKALALVDLLFACGHPWNCPHGRPTFVRIPKARFEEWFMRRV